MSQWPSTKARRVLAALLRIGCSVKRSVHGSHRVLTHPDWPDVVFAFHDNDGIGPRVLARIAKHTGLTPEDLCDTCHMPTRIIASQDAEKVSQSIFTAYDDFQAQSQPNAPRATSRSPLRMTWYSVDVGTLWLFPSPTHYAMPIGSGNCSSSAPGRARIMA